MTCIVHSIWQLFTTLQVEGEEGNEGGEGGEGDSRRLFMYYSWELPPPFVSCCDGDGKIRRKGLFHITLHASRDFSDIPQSMITVESFIIHLKHPSPYPWKILPATCLGKGPNLVPTQGEEKKLSIPHAFVHHETKFNKNTNGEHFA